MQIIPAQLDSGNVLVTTNALMPIGSVMDITIVVITLTRIPYTAAASQVTSPVPTSSVFRSGMMNEATSDVRPRGSVLSRDSLVAVFRCLGLGLGSRCRGLVSGV